LEDAALRAVIDANADGIVVVDRTGVVVYANGAAGALFGRGASELVGTEFGFPLVAGSTTELDVVGRAEDAAVVEMRTVAVDWKGKPAYLASLRDITDRRRAERERAERERAEAAKSQAEAAVRARDAFLAMAAHELKTPLARLTLTVEGALRRGRRRRALVTPEQALAVVETEAAHLTRLVRQLVDVARVDTGALALERTATDLRSVVHAALGALRRVLSQQSISVRLPSEPVLAWVDRAVLCEVLADVIANAVRYGGETAPGEVELSNDGGGQAALLSVRDHGPPVPPEVRAGLLSLDLAGSEKEYRPGWAIALHLARRVAELHGGRIELSFPQGGGTEVRLVLPCEPPAEVAAPT
jgi:signal transduction histidine kinase